ncbi:hypothetical protein [Gimesia sp.]|uniref:hypothetical protein n=1 Tax=Gimesia sp. TaxID=2024833 RepID=UPI003A9568D7
MHHQYLIKSRITGTMALCLSGLLICFQAGCTQSADSAQDENHLEHHIPEHKPKTYSATVKELDTRMRRLLNQDQEEGTQKKQQELAEIIDWIPELAADSELKHSDWNEVKQFSSELKTVFQQFNFSDSEIDSSLVGRYFLLVVKLKQYSGPSEMKKFNG